MTLPFFAFAIGAMLLYAGMKNLSVSDALQGKPPPKEPQNPGEDTSLLAAALSSPAGIAGAALGSAEDAPDKVISYQGKQVCGWIVEALKYASAHGWHGSITSGYRSPADQARVCATGVKPCAAPGTSRHQGKAWPDCAVDVTDAPGLNRVLAGSPYAKKLVWAGSRDPVHFSSGGSNGKSGY